jgi:hypothetical protein
MAMTRRALMQDLAGVGGLAALLARPGVAEALGQAMGEAAGQPPGNSQAFWSTFLESSHSRGLFHHLPGTESNRQVNFLHYSADGLRYSEQIGEDELPDYPGDVGASLNVGGLRLSSADRQQYNDLKSAQLRIDMLQGKRMFNLLDPLSWTAIAGIFPSAQGTLPPLQNLSFDPSTSLRNMQQIVLPGGVAHLAVNLSMIHRDSAFGIVLKQLANNAPGIASLLGLPAISVTALQGFSQFYGTLESKAQFLFQTRPTLAFTTRAARRAQDSTIGMNLPPGDYVLVPQAYTDQLKPFLKNLKLVNGYLVDKNAPETNSVYEQAEATKPDISYLTLHVGINSLPQMSDTTRQG